MYLSLAIQEIVSKATCESNKDTNKQTNKQTISFRSNSIPFYCATFKVTSLKENVFIYYRIRANNIENGLYGQKYI